MFQRTEMSNNQSNVIQQECKSRTSQQLSSLYCSVKESETLSAPKFQAREQVQGQGQFEVVKGTSGERGRGMPHQRGLQNNSHLPVSTNCLHQSLFLDPNLCVIWQEKRYLQVHKCQSQFQAGRLPSVNLMRVLK